MEAWHAFYINAWQTLRFDRNYFGMGGQTPITFSALDAYARRYSIEGEAFDRFLSFMQQIDAEWMALENEREKSAPSPAGS